MACPMYVIEGLTVCGSIGGIGHIQMGTIFEYFEKTCPIENMSGLG